MHTGQCIPKFISTRNLIWTHLLLIFFLNLCYYNIHKLTPSFKHKHTQVKRPNPADEAEDVAFCLGPQELSEANRRAITVTLPVGFGYKPSPIYTTQKMKSHDWIQVIKTILVLYPCKITFLLSYLKMLSVLYSGS